MENNIILVALPQEDIEEIKKLCLLALKEINGEEAEFEFLIAELRDGKIQLRMKGAKSSTFMMVVSEEARDTYASSMPKIFEQTNMYIYENLDSFKTSLKSAFPDIDLGEEEAEEEVIDEVDELDEVEVIEEVEEQDEENDITSSFVIPSILEESSENNYKAQIATLEAQNKQLEAELIEYRENDAFDKATSEELERVNNELEDIKKQKESLESEIADLKQNIEIANQQSAEANQSLNEELQKCKEELRGKEEQLANKVLEIETINKDLEKMDELSNLAEKGSVLEDEIETYKREIETLKSDIESKDEELLRLMDDSAKKDKELEEKDEQITQLSDKIDNVTDITSNEEYQNMEKELEDYATELSKLRNQLSETTSTLNNKEKSYAKLESKYKDVSENVFTKLGKKAMLSGVINNTVFSNIPRANVTIFASGTGESLEDTASYLRRFVVNRKKNTVILDFDMGSYIDLYFGIERKSNNVLANVLDGVVGSLEACYSSTNVDNCKYVALSKGFINESGLLSLDWELLFKKMSFYQDTDFIINVGCISSIVKAILLNSAVVSNLETIVVTKATTINLRALMYTLTGIKYAGNVDYVCMRHSGTNVPAVFDKFASKYRVRLESEDDLPQEI